MGTPLSHALNQGRRPASRVGALFAVACLVAAACGGAKGKGATTPTAAVAAPVVAPRKPGPMKPVVPSKMGKRLAEVGLDPKNLPPIENLTEAQRDHVMRMFTDSLGVPCVGCHAAGDTHADTARKRVAKRMYNEITRLLATDKGEPVFCDSCHQGSMWVLDRKDKDKVSDFMSDQYAGSLKLTDGRDAECETCHGATPEFAFIAQWKKIPAPDLLPPPPPKAPAPTPTVAATPDAGPATPPPPPRPVVKRPPRAKGACGDKHNLCPLQKWMRVNVSTAVAAEDTQKLAAALARVATLSPDPAWTSWRDMSLAASEAAKRGDMKEARKSCRKCHTEYRDKWRSGYRARPVK